MNLVYLKQFVSGHTLAVILNINTRIKNVLLLLIICIFCTRNFLVLYLSLFDRCCIRIWWTSACFTEEVLESSLSSPTPTSRDTHTHSLSPTKKRYNSSSYHTLSTLTSTCLLPPGQGVHTSSQTHTQIHILEHLSTHTHVIRHTYITW